ncbi:TPA: ANR family transcriptional regulator [Vibrio parahaemolyticus]
MRQEYLEIAQKACIEERIGNWRIASELWMKSIEFSSKENKFWAEARFKFCYNRSKLNRRNHYSY